MRDGLASHTAKAVTSSGIDAAISSSMTSRYMELKAHTASKRRAAFGASPSRRACVAPHSMASSPAARPTAYCSAPRCCAMAALSCCTRAAIDARHHVDPHASGRTPDCFLRSGVQRLSSSQV